MFPENDGNSFLCLKWSETVWFCRFTGNLYSGATVYDSNSATMTCTISKMETSRATSKSVKRDYKFVVRLYRSREYALSTPEQTKVDHDEAKEVDPDHLAEAADDEAHSAATNKETVFVVVIKRLLVEFLMLILLFPESSENTVFVDFFVLEPIGRRLQIPRTAP